MSPRGVMTALCAICTFAGCDRAAFESLGTLSASGAGAVQGVSPLQSHATGGENALPFSGGVDAGSGMNTGASGMNALSGNAGLAGAYTPAGSGSAVPPDGLSGQFGTTPFEAVKSAYVIGRSDEFGTTTVYLIDTAVSCNDISSLAWLTQLSSDVQVIELSFASSAMTGVPLSNSVVSYAHGGMISFTKTLASAHTLILSENTAGGTVSGTLNATFSSGSVGGDFQADFCATGVGF